MQFQEDKISSIDLITNDIPLDEHQVSALFKKFMQEFRINDIFPYRNILSSHITISVDHLSIFNAELAQLFFNNPMMMISLFEKILETEYSRTVNIQITTSKNITPIGAITSAVINKVIKVRGIVLSTGPVFARPTSLYLVCKTCLAQKWCADYIPRTCKPDCGMDPFTLVCEKSRVIDSQYIKVQEEEKSDARRNLCLVFEDKMVNKVIPGQFVTATGIYLKRDSFCFLKVIGLESDNQIFQPFSISESDFFANIDKKKIFRSIAPMVYGHIDIKIMLACMLFGGTAKSIYQNKIRGNIHVLLLGDPGIAKSQFLKFISKVSPVGIYTSGKGSSAAGLTASVLRDKTGFYLEAGALVLADDGICCIDEFDKMDYDDQVAIHEAMEQQTISISKAGITTTLNSRTAILAAANPKFGRYDEYKSPGENVTFGPTILSRFDSIFIIKDVANKESDRAMARHVLKIHQMGDSCNDEEKGEEFGVKTLKSELETVNKYTYIEKDENLEKDVSAKDTYPLETLKRYIQYAKSKVRPSISKEASKMLSEFYVDTRRKVRSIENIMREKSSIPITIRQLEAIIRISESLAKISLRSEVIPEDVEEAIRLFSVSTLNAVSQGHYCEGMVRSDFQMIIDEIMIDIKKALPIGCSKSYVNVLTTLSGYEQGLVTKAIDFMVKTGKLLLRDNSRVIVRLP